MKLYELISYLESAVPLSYQESYDNSGIQVGDPLMEVKSVLLCLDVTEEIIEEALSKSCDLVISHHPLIFKPLSSISGKTAVERILLKAVRNDISVYSMHTNLDMIRGGVSYKLADKLEMTDLDVLVPLAGKLIKLVVFVPAEHAYGVRDAMFNAGAGYIGDYDRCSYNLQGKGTFRAGPGTDPYSGEQGKEHEEEELRIETIIPDHLKSRVVRAMIEAHPYEEVAYDLYRLENEVPGAGLGCTGYLEKEMKDKDFIRFVSEKLGAEGIRHTAPVGRKIRKVAVMGGSGANYTGRAIAAGADAFITGDVKYHTFFEADNSILLADIGHYESEIHSITGLYELITKKFPKFAVRFSEINTNPVNYLQAWKK